MHFVIKVFGKWKNSVELSKIIRINVSNSRKYRSFEWNQVLCENLKKIDFFLVLGFIFATTAAEEDYCDEQICPPETKHVACNTELVCIQLIQTVWIKRTGRRLMRRGKRRVVMTLIINFRRGTNVVQTMRNSLNLLQNWKKSFWTRITSWETV